MIQEYMTDIEAGIDQIQVGKKKTVGLTYYKLPIYNPKIMHPQQKFWFVLPKVKIVSNSNNNTVVALSDSDSKFIKFVDDLHIKIKKIINIKLMPSFSNKKHQAITMSIKLLSNTPIFDENDLETDSSNIIEDKCVSCYIELTDVYIADDCAWIIWNFLQIKLLNQINFRKSLFISLPNKQIKHPVNIPDIISNNLIPTAPPLINSPMSNKNQIAHSDSDSKPKEFQKLFISQSDLLQQINKLKKKTATVPQLDSKDSKINSVSLDLLKGITLNKTITKEPLPLSAWYNQAKKDEKNNLPSNKLNMKKELDIMLAHKIKIQQNLKSIYDKYDSVTS